MASSDQLAHKLKVVGVGFLLGLTVLSLILGGLYLFALPKFAQNAVEDRLASLEKRTGLEITTEAIKTQGLEGVRILGLSIQDPAHAQWPLLRVETMRVKLDKVAALAGKKNISSLDLDGVTLHLVRQESGRFNLQTLKTDATPQEKKDTPSSSSRLQRALERFGGQLPRLDATRLKVLFHDHAPPKKFSPLPLESLEIPALSLHPDTSDTATLSFTMLPVASPQALAQQWSIPRKIDVAGEVTLPLEDSSVKVTMDKALLWRAPTPYDWVEVGFEGLEVRPGAMTVVTAPRVRLRHSPTDFKDLFSATRLDLQLHAWPLPPQDLRIKAMEVHDPILSLQLNRDGTTPLDPLKFLFWPEAPRAVARHARAVAQRQVQAAPTAPPTPERGASTAHALRSVSAVMAHLPDQIKVTQGRVTLVDLRPGTTMPTVALAISRIEMTHDPDQGTLHALGQLKALGGKGGAQEKGEVSGTLKAKLKGARQVAMTAKVAGLDLAWLAQILPFGPMKSIQAGRLEATWAMESTQGEAFHFKGNVQGTGLRALVPKLSEQPIKDWRLGYDFEGHFDPSAPIPPAKLLTTTLDANVPEDLEEKPSRRVITISPPTQGALVFSQGKAIVGELQFEAKPAFYGIDLTKPFPARLDLALTLPPTPVQTALDSIPDALLGDLASLRLAGTTSLTTQLEVPMYDAGSMVWVGEPEFKDLDILQIDPVMDPRKLVDRFQHVIQDESVLFERVVTIPAMQYVPDLWLKENVGLDDAGIKAHWGRWWGERERRTASKPWAEGSSAGLGRRWRSWSKSQTTPLEPNPYGAYVFVPLQHISPWLIRAILTTEDNSFFRHDGFNRLALRQSIERNLAAGDYVRGASTISMQLVKNLFLTRKKVMSRKIQEALLVWLMENRVRVPKARLMEIYLNIIEFGPGIFGIHDAAIHYFGKRPDELSLSECAWLVTIVPGPKRQHFYYTQGELSERYFERIKRYIKIMLSRERITEAEYLAAIETKPEFYKPLDPTAPVLRPKPVPTLFPSLDFFDTPTAPPEGQMPPTQVPSEQTPPKSLWD